MMQLHNPGSAVRMGRLRHIQASFEPPALLDAGVLARKLLSVRERPLGLCLLSKE